MRSKLIEGAQHMVETDQLDVWDYLQILKEVDSMSEAELQTIIENELVDGLQEGTITDEEFDALIDEYAQDIGDEDGMQECNKMREEDNLDECNKK